MSYNIGCRPINCSTGNVLISTAIHFDIVNQSQADGHWFTQPFIAFSALSGL